MRPAPGGPPREPVPVGPAAGAGATAVGGPRVASVSGALAGVDGGAPLWAFFAGFVEARHAFRLVRRRYERKVLAAAEALSVARANLVLPPAELWQLFDLKQLVGLRDRYLGPLRLQADAIFGERGDDGLMDAFCGHVYHELAILCEEHRSVGRFVRLHDPERYRELFQEVSGYYPTRLKRIHRFFDKGLERLEELLPGWARHRVVVRSACLFGERLGRWAWREGRAGLYARMYPQGRAAKGWLEAARSFHAAGFDDRARDAAGRALAAARAQAAESGAPPAAAGLVRESEAFVGALEGEVGARPGEAPPAPPVVVRP